MTKLTPLEILIRIGVVNPPKEASIKNKVNLQFEVPLHLIKKMEEVGKQLGIKGKSAPAQMLCICMFRTVFFADDEESKLILNLLVKELKFRDLSPDVKEVSEQ